MRDWGSKILGTWDGSPLVAGVVHAHSTFSDGACTPAELAQLARSKGLGVVCVTDHHYDDWVWRFGIGIRRSSVLRNGLRQYLDTVQAVDSAEPDLIVLAGLGILPHYRWQGVPPFLRCEAMKTLMAFGLGDGEWIEDLPTVLAGPGADEPEACCVAQRTIDHIRARGGFVFWSHLEEDERARVHTATLRNRPRPELLSRTTGYACRADISSESGEQILTNPIFVLPESG